LTKRFLLFFGEIYYPDGGWQDFKGSFDACDIAMQFFHTKIGEERPQYYWTQIIDTQTWKPVWAYKYKRGWFQPFEGEDIGAFA
jgi:hypothetical protein